MGGKDDVGTLGFWAALGKGLLFDGLRVLVRICYIVGAIGRM